MHKGAYMNVMEKYVDLYKALSDKMRLRIMWVLCRANQELCVCEIMDSLDESQYNVSRHLKILKNSGLVQERKEGRWVFYSLSKPANQVNELLLQTILAIPQEVLNEDAVRLEKRLSLRKDGKVVIGMECNLKT
ncbi:MAG: metalloregulator ArsR/SmtB family transcription factor [candidate division WOR-3 bacterium]|nr:metalloregulator ArsR/SmtB family transcription factor [candidate division WOR-3 bacterium]